MTVAKPSLSDLSDRLESLENLFATLATTILQTIPDEKARRAVEEVGEELAYDAEKEKALLAGVDVVTFRAQWKGKAGA